MFSPNLDEKVKCENCGTQSTQLNLGRPKYRCSFGSPTCSSCTNFSTKSRDQMNYYLAKNHSKPTARVVHKCKKCDKNFQSFRLLREHKKKEHGAQRGLSAQKGDVEQVMGDVDGNSQKQELETCKPFW